jgi:hypothetical protein
MRALIFRCPATGLNIQGLAAESMIGPNTICIPMDCPICGRPHLIDPKTGKSPRDDEESNA